MCVLTHASIHTCLHTHTFTRVRKNFWPSNPFHLSGISLASQWPSMLSLSQLSLICPPQPVSPFTVSGTMEKTCLRMLKVSPGSAKAFRVIWQDSKKVSLGRNSNIKHNLVLDTGKKKSSGFFSLTFSLFSLPSFPQGKAFSHRGWRRKQQQQVGIFKNTSPFISVSAPILLHLCGRLYQSPPGVLFIVLVRWDAFQMGYLLIFFVFILNVCVCTCMCTCVCLCRWVGGWGGQKGT